MCAGMEVKGTDLCEQCALDVVSGRGRELKEVLEITGLAEVTLAPELDGEAPVLLPDSQGETEHQLK